ncbi:RNA deprotection pyrophosphohydrolase [Robertmurraya korlensis]|jgi:8-oxo-dGTP diphosphatase|uniref:RNA deprotection pyrophosphohydrolase n=1 Tax=Robertmurraya korlensis TaxID=519977 RepID=UPI0008259353|nr:nucleoside triphosphatase YtkD [Robertmurraya korlensis]
MEIFRDHLGAQVLLSFGENKFGMAVQHVLILSKYKNGWVLTKHKERGLEFPGGKVERGETVEEAANREVFEETGGVLKKLIKIGHYEVRNDHETFVKAIFYGEVEELVWKENFLETDGPVFIDDPQLSDRFSNGYSFIMKDSVVEKSLRYIQTHFL